MRGGIILPDRQRTPGAVDPHVTQANIGSTICVPGYTATIRPNSAYTTALKVKQLGDGYNYRGDTSTADYEEDHLISLELGGSPSSPRNLWPEPYNAREGATVKDEIENKLHALVCSRTITLRRAQHAIATNWWAAYHRYLSVEPTPTHAATSAVQPAKHRRSPPRLHSCTTTSTGSCIRAGEFCSQADYRHTGYDANGRALTCGGDATHPRWDEPRNA